MTTFAQKPADLSPVIEQHIIRVENRLNAAQMALEMMTVSNYTNRKSTKDLLSDCERLQKSAAELHQVMCGLDQASLRIDLSSFLSESQGQTSNDSLLSAPVKPKTEKTNRSKSGAASDIAQFAKARLENQQNIKAEYAEFKTKDWVQLLLIKSEKAYKGLQVEIDSEQITIKTFDDYCLHARGLSRRWVSENLDMLQEFGPDLFTALNSINTHFKDKRKVRKLSADQKQALLQVAQTGDKAATLQFIEQALQAGE